MQLQDELFFHPSRKPAMPVHGHKVDSKCFGMSRKVDAFLGLGNVGKSPYLPADFWGDLSQSKEAVSRYCKLH